MSTTAAVQTTERDQERERLRVALERRRATRAAEALQDTYALERRLERSAGREIRQTGQIARASALERRLMRETAIARRRDALTRALDYPMSGAELIAACQHSTLAAKVPAQAFEDVSQALALYVIRRHGREPVRAKVSSSGLQRLATALYLEKRRKDERATGARAAADELHQWRAQDHRAAMADAARAGDLVWSLAAHRPAPGGGARPMSAADVARPLPISSGQAEALALAINTSNVRPLTSTERVQWLNARRAITRRYPDTLALMLAIRPEIYAAEILANAAIRAERRRAAVGSRGGSPASYYGPADRRNGPRRLPARRLPIRLASVRPDLGCYPVAVGLRRGGWRGRPADVLAAIDRLMARLPASI